MQSSVQMLKKIYQKTDETLEIFKFFIEGDWRFENKKIYGLLNNMSP